MIDPARLTDLFCDLLKETAPELSGHVKVGRDESTAVKRIIGDPDIAHKIAARAELSPDIAAVSNSKEQEQTE